MLARRIHPFSNVMRSQAPHAPPCPPFRPGHRELLASGSEPRDAALEDRRSRGPSLARSADGVHESGGESGGATIRVVTLSTRPGLRHRRARV